MEMNWELGRDLGACVSITLGVQNQKRRLLAYRLLLCNKACQTPITVVIREVDRE